MSRTHRSRPTALAGQPRSSHLSCEWASPTSRLPITVQVEIREAVARDLAALGTWSGNVEPVFRPAMETNTGLLLVATANGRFPIGHVLVSLQGRQPGAGSISHLLVLAGFRGQGVGSALMHAGHSVLHTAGLHVAELRVEQVNVEAIRLYERLGYARVGEAVEIWSEPAEDGTMRPVEHPSWVMQRWL